jgi:D-threo-aldose 1-dehydrogenase
MSSLEHTPSLFGAGIGRAVDSLDVYHHDRTDRYPAGSATSDVGLHLQTASRLGFGCAGLMRCASGRRRQRLLGEAFEQGIRHFDVARMYGLGAAERELGLFARRHREEIVIATKFGIEPAGPIGRLGRLQAPARAAVARLPALRAALKRRAEVFHQPRGYDAATARASLETSLRELRTDHVDVLFVHDPAPGDPIDTTELGAALEDMCRAGLVRAWGFAGEPDPCIELSRAVGAPTILQVRDDIFTETRSQIPPAQPTITFGVLAPALERILGHVRASEERRLRWQRTIGVDCGRPEALCALLLQDALERNPTGAVLFSTTRVGRVKVATAAADALASEGDRGPLRAFRELVMSEPISHVPARG